MVLREMLEEREAMTLSPYACRAAETRGRLRPEEKCEMRTDFQRDRDRIIHSKSLRRLMHKTQVFLSPEGDHFRTRLTHTLEVAQIARTIARALDLNEDLTEAIAMGHDLGHTPFGHHGEYFLNQHFPGGFAHNVQSLRVVDVIDRNAKGNTMNLTAEVRDGIVNHSGPNIPFTLEGRVVRISDRIAYINHDIDDALRGGIIRTEDIPRDCLELFGASHGERIDALVKDVVRNSDGKNDILQSGEFGFYMNKLRDFMFEAVYNNPVVKGASETMKINHLLLNLYEYYLKNPDKMPDEARLMIDSDGIEVAVKDHIAGMTDRYAISAFEKIFVPEGWKVR
ncbi:MAG: deoxyguanosinetriphosphate triphosphohydrolase [Firmicutes bacterium]|nr:deoxyguanosinetriphosphate triphosphohydrolase [Bacillota bacterium]MBR0114312.1 deoxyguanosinetriphosphate triphosphohydrolase [Bacillota bacterium]MBR0440426.1 deoxyguanosinetriphosphate triphosphohydrolase [Bacillota bacterium]MBR0523219.1 deoxyguanosinetriphosphate triphosphohydrolase [Bacillota bacterium]